MKTAHSVEAYPRQGVCAVKTAHSVDAYPPPGVCAVEDRALRRRVSAPQRGRKPFNSTH